MVPLVRDYGWTLISSEGILGYNHGAKIEKDGLIISYYNSKGEEDIDIYLRYPVHTDTNVDLRQRRNLYRILDHIGAKFDRECIFSVTNDKADQIKSYLLDKSIWKRDFEKSARQLLAYYQKSMAGPALLQETARLMERHHPWLPSGKIPSVDGAGGDEPSSSTKIVRAVVLGAVGVGMAVAHFWKWPS